MSAEEPPDFPGVSAGERREAAGLAGVSGR
jgi:hypothetical protein